MINLIPYFVSEKITTSLFGGSDETVAKSNPQAGFESSEG